MPARGSSSCSRGAIDRSPILAADLPRAINTPEIRIDCADEEKFAVVSRATESLRNDPAVRDVVTIDGVRARFEDGWGLVRASNTQPALVVRCEANSQDALSAIKKMIETHVAHAKREEAL